MVSNTEMAADQTTEMAPACREIIRQLAFIRRISTEASRPTTQKEASEMTESRVAAEDLSIGDVHSSFGACDMIEGPVDGLIHIGWEEHDSGWVSTGTLFTVSEGYSC